MNMCPTLVMTVVLGEGLRYRKIQPPFKSNAEQHPPQPLLDATTLRRPGTETRPDPLFVCYLGSPTDTPIDHECSVIVAAGPTRAKKAG